MIYMAFSKLTGAGSECGSDNGLTHLMKQLRQDRSLQQDRYHPQGESSKSVSTFRSKSNQSPVFAADNLADEFFQHNEQKNRSNTSSPFEAHIPPDTSSVVKEDWVRDFSNHSQSSSPGYRFKEFEHIYQRHTPIRSPVPQSPTIWTEEFSNFQQIPSPDVSEEEQLAFERVFEEMNDSTQMDRDWDKEFADHETWEAQHRIQQQQPQPQALRTTPVRSSSELLDAKDWTKEFSQYHDLTAQGKAALTKSLENEEEWIKNYKQSIDSKATELEQKEYDRLQPDGKPYGYRAIHPEYEVYHYMADNPYLSYPEAINAVHTTLADTIMALEAKAQLAPEDAKTWEQLGLKQQENERDAAAITALEKAVAIDPNCIDAWLALAVSYTNEHCRMDAYNCLEQWIANSSNYKHILKDGKLGYHYTDEMKRHDYITQLFLEAARTAPGEEMDADVQVGLGVLFNMSEEYDKAVDCFKAALISRPYDYQLWNKVGATLANSRDSMGAIEMYFNALQINPSFVRARYNLAISCMNLGQHREAAEHLLTALDLQRAAAMSAGQAARAAEKSILVDVPNGTSDGIWDSLRLLMYMMSREDLAAECDHRNLDAFRGQFDF
ncbi:uncharacterized protein BX663DRAFT_498628 [Cokeromyces recurvatus]|uniref:uncharacterized protein n=1 Tax=Cokeromyces recurvatus TaxID=90255 RepID=UPI00221FF3C6|nr:uncharacterized protein BX663DRAFT_498628 [Cokeromyces recurvatus]KAI7906056.1 hypothetical protein BX663DRAFT_498628 [Cokeromyces recurvatus]